MRLFKPIIRVDTEGKLSIEIIIIPFGLLGYLLNLSKEETNSIKELLK